jgi:hypothetical protein
MKQLKGDRKNAFTKEMPSFINSEKVKGLEKLLMLSVVSSSVPESLNLYQEDTISFLKIHFQINSLML